MAICKIWYNKIHNLRFGTKIFLSYLIVIFILLSIWNVVSYRQTNNSILSQVNANFDENFNSLVRQTNRKMENLMDQILLFTSNSSFGAIVCRQYKDQYMEYYDITNTVDPMLLSLQMSHPEIEEIEIFTEGSIKGAREMFKSYEAFSLLYNISAPIHNMEPVWFVQDDTVLLAKKVISPEDPFALSAILISVDYSYIFDESSMPDMEQYGILISDSQGNILFRRDAMPLAAKESGYTPEEVFSQAEAPSGSDLIVRKNLLESSNWYIYMYANTNSLLLSPLDSFKTTLFFFLIISILMLLIAFGFSQSFSKRISALNTYTRHIVKNHFQNSISSDIKDEIGEITNSIGQMVTETRQYIDEVYENRIALKEAEIKALQSQINPHFLYNTLSSINWMAIYRGDKTISEIITNLSNFYRSTLNRNSSVTTIEHELETTKAYIDIQLMVYKNTFDVIFHILPSVLEYQIPSIILQPIVENAIEHGILALPENKRGQIIISAYEEDSDILFDIFDNGPGLSEEEAKSILESSSKGYGVKNVNDRLKLFFDDTYGITFTSSPDGLTVTIRIPKYIDLNEDF